MSSGLLKAYDDRIQMFHALLQKWSTAFSLLSKTDRLDLDQHLLDSLSVIPYIKEGPILDLGSGAGLPGIPLAIVLPEKNFVLLDSNGKKTRFLQQAVLELGLKNVEIVQARVESYRSDEGFDQIICRAFSSLYNIVQCSQHLLKQEGEFLAMKGKLDEKELSEVPNGFKVARVIPLKVPGIEHKDRHLICIQRQSI